MSKIEYPSEGLVPAINDNLTSVKDNLSNARSNCIYSVPRNFPYLGSLKQLPIDIDDMKRRISEIYNIAKNNDDSVRIMLETMDEYNKSLDLTIIEERGRLVK